MLATRRSSRLRTSLVATAVGVLVLLSGCSSHAGGGGGDSSSSDTGSVHSAAGFEAKSQPAADVAQKSDPGQPGPGVEQQQVISTGNVQLRSDDVGQAVFDVRKVVDEHQGTIAEDDTETDKGGSPLRSRMVVRIPTADFDRAMDELEKVATLISSSRKSADVTTQVLDVNARVEAQRRSLDRVQVLFDHATSIKDIVSIEGELSGRQADLESLEAQQRYLSDQTSLSTISVSVERTAKGAPQPEHHDKAGFLSGLSDGWDAMRTFLVGASTVAGALLPWLLLALVLAAAGWPILRRVRRERPLA